MQITVNGKVRECPDGWSVSDLLAELGVKKEGTAVEVNRQIVPKAKHAETRIRTGDVIEVVTFVGGG